ncbi:Short chain dehydrogenase [Coniochaeta hoffmannii]|uniref:Short chain dehydrogenase n=1 Tax=Coniochaeta hoffmannii TaxID=91930 RepID=A0AA38VQ95_9PEZI|nr:Short chain dehydrogenase [Coniochaeta hoffmannii]
MASLIDPSPLLQRLNQWWSASSSTTAVLTALGFLTAARLAYSILDFTYFYLKPSKLRRYLHLPQQDPNKQHPWALVTGATDGIGKAFAHELAKHGLNVVIHGRNAAKLATVEEQLRAAHPGREFRTLMVDAGEVGCASCLRQRETGLPVSSAVVDFDAVVRSLSDLHLTVVVSNAGGAPHPVYRTLDQIPEAELAANVSLNALFPLHLLSRLLPLLARNAPSLIITVGSLADNGLPLLSSYGPSKAFLTSLAGVVARDVRLEGRDVEVVGMRCGRVTGVGHQRTPPTLLVPDAGTWAAAALGRVGAGSMECVPYWPHALQQVLGVGMLPGWARERLFRRIMSGLREEERGRLRAEGKGKGE